MVKKDNTIFPAQRSYLSSGDIEGIKAIYGPPFHRLKTELIQVLEENFTPTYERYHYKYSNIIYFYADKECKVKTKLTHPRKLRYTKIRTVKLNNPQDPAQTYRTVEEILVPAGCEYWELDWTDIDVEMNYGDETGEWQNYSEE